MSQYAMGWSEVITQNESKLLAYLRNILRCPYSAEDALQNTFIRLAGMSDGQNKEVLNSTSFCFQVARNIALDMIRKQSRDAYVELEDEQFEQIGDTKPDVESAFINEKANIEINQAISKLSNRHQNVARFYREGRLKQKEIAKVYNISPTLLNFLLKEVIQTCKAAVAH